MNIVASVNQCTRRVWRPFSSATAWLLALVVPAYLVRPTRRAGTSTRSPLIGDSNPHETGPRDAGCVVDICSAPLLPYSGHHLHERARIRQLNTANLRRPPHSALDCPHLLAGALPGIAFLVDVGPRGFDVPRDVDRYLRLVGSANLTSPYFRTPSFGSVSKRRWIPFGTMPPGVNGTATWCTMGTRGLTSILDPGLPTQADSRRSGSCRFSC